MQSARQFRVSNFSLTNEGCDFIFEETGKGDKDYNADLLLYMSTIATIWRKTLLSRCPTMAVHYFRVLRNTSQNLYIDFIQHRLAMVPLCVSNMKQFEQFVQKYVQEKENHDGTYYETRCRHNHPIHAQIIHYQPRGTMDCTISSQLSALQLSKYNAYQYVCVHCSVKITCEVKAPSDAARDVLVSDLQIDQLWNEGHCFYYHPDLANIVLCRLSPGEAFAFEAFGCIGTQNEHAKWTIFSSVVTRPLPHITVEPKTASPSQLLTRLKEVCPKGVFNDIEELGTKSPLIVSNAHKCTYCGLCQREETSSVQIYPRDPRCRIQFSFRLAYANQFPEGGLSIFIDSMFSILIHELDMTIEMIKTISTDQLSYQSVSSSSNRT